MFFPPGGGAYFTWLLTLMVQGGHNVPALFSGGYFSMKKGSIGPKFLDFSYYKLSENEKKLVFHSDFGSEKSFNEFSHAPHAHSLLKLTNQKSHALPGCFEKFRP